MENLIRSSNPLHFREESRIDPERLMQFVASTPDVSFSPQGELEWAVGEQRGPQLLGDVRSLLQSLAA